MLCIIAMYYNFHKEKNVFLYCIYLILIFLCMLQFPNVIENFYTFAFIL